MSRQRLTLLTLTGLFGLIASTAPAQADIYKYVDADGNVTFTDKPRNGARRIVSEPSANGVQGSTKKGLKSPTYRASPPDFPKVDRATQSKRDDVRRQLLEEELRSEQNSLATARAAAAAPKPGGDATRLAETVRLHEKNIEMLNKELARIK